MRQVSIVAETLTAGSPVAQILVERGVQVTPGNLAAGHFLITSQCAVLHLTVETFTQWIAEKAVFRKITDYKRAVAEPVVIVEGALDDTSRKSSRAALRAALAFIAVHNRVPILFAADPAETADLLFAMANQVQNGMGIKLGSEAPPKSAVADNPAEGELAAAGANGNGNGNGHGHGHQPEIQLVDLPVQILSMLPDIGTNTARALLKRFGSLKGVFGASASDLTRVDGVGPRKAKKLASFIGRRGER